ncbi:MAG: hypothetical protein ABR601_01685 [Parasphingopyxis sp.]
MEEKNIHRPRQIGQNRRFRKAVPFRRRSAKDLDARRRHRTVSGTIAFRSKIIFGAAGRGARKDELGGLEVPKRSTLPIGAPADFDFRDGALATAHQICDRERILSIPSNVEAFDFALQRPIRGSP